MNGTQQTDTKRQHLLERLLDAVKQCQIRFGGRKEIATDSDSRVICLCAQFEAVLQHGLRKSRGLALTAAALKQAAGFSSKTEGDLTFWFYVKEHLNRHELQRFYSLRHISSELGRGRAWLRCALNEHSLERYLHSLVADRTRLSTYYEDWAFILDEERASMLPTMAAGLNSILFAINIDNTDLNGGVTRGGGSSVSNLLKESTQGIGSLLKESTQGVSSLLREISTATAVVPGFTPRGDGGSDPLPVLPRSTSADSGLRKERRKKKKITNIISFDDDLDGGAEDEEEAEEDHQNNKSLRKSHTAPAQPQSSVEEGVDPLENSYSASPAQNGVMEAGIVSWVGSPHPSRTPPLSTPVLPDSKSLDNEEEEEEEEVYKPRAQEQEEERTSSEQLVVGSLTSVSTWSPLQVMVEHSSSDILIPVNAADPQPVSSVEDTAAFPAQIDSTGPTDNCESSSVQLTFNMESSSPAQPAPISTALPTSALPESMSVVELRQAIVAMMNRKDELDEQNASLRSLLDGEMEHSATLRQESEQLKKKLTELEERHEVKVQALARENEVLKVQLKKYVGAVQMLKREGSSDALSVLRSSEDVAPAPQNKFIGDIEELAASYERKLIEVAEMHGELIEFNERLYRSLMAKDHLIVQMRQELIDLRGPLPGDLSQTSDDPSLSDFETAHRALINVWIPSVFLQGRAANAYHVYQVYIRIHDNEWNVYRRYTEFRELHNLLRAQFPQVDTFNFPPKKALGNKDAKFVEERRKQLQCYLRMVMNKVVQTLPEFSTRPTKETLLTLLPFCQDTPQTNDNAAKTPRSRTSSRFPRLGRNRNQDARPEPQSGDL
ncbi:sorting nexin-29 [Boleophthalmus pectinirostris]|uniref:sorting nexin-29 n=1 Tax=Boleophthalmus pectinirostris TaxID=150288 RepID=UPI000A1C4829|nr:sorting nexin-29 [Boleophthalmus pectinirostris]